MTNRHQQTQKTNDQSPITNDQWCGLAGLVLSMLSTVSSIYVIYCVCVTSIISAILVRSVIYITSVNDGTFFALWPQGLLCRSDCGLPGLGFLLSLMNGFVKGSLNGAPTNLPISNHR